MGRRRFGRYEVQQEIGDGAMGRVYRCVDPLMLRVVAVKTVKTEYLTRDTREEYLRRFRREAQAAGRLSHPHIVGIYDVGEDYFVMEYLEGSTLQGVLRERGRLALPDALSMLAELADALDYAHRAGIVHRDIKPGNVMVVRDGKPKLMDFGVAHLESSVMTAAGHFFGSPSYMAPEQVSGGELSAAADLFSFAVVAYETITGHRPFEGESITVVMYRVVNSEPPPPRQWDPDLPPIYDDIFRRALSKDPAQRFPDATSLVSALVRQDLEAARSAPPRLADGAAGTVIAPEEVSAFDVETQDLTDVTPAPRATMLPGTSTGTDIFSTMARRAGLVAAAAVAVVGLAYMSGRRAVVEPLPSPGSGAPVVFRIETEPPGATVWVDGTVAGPAPVSLQRVLPGVHNVRVAADGYAPASLSLEVRAGEPPPPLRFVMESMLARLVVNTEPMGALVTVDGQPVGTTPLDEVSVSPGGHDVLVEKPGFTPFIQHVDGKAGGTVELTPRLVRRPPQPGESPSALGRGWVTAGMLVPLDETVTPPRLVSGKPAPYPEAARRLHLVGSVTVEMIVDDNGETKDPHVIQSAGEMLDRAVLDAVRGWRYEPATKNGVKVKVRIQAHQTFVVD